MLLKKHGMYAENSGGLALNSGYPELGLNPELLRAFKEIGVAMLPASDAHRWSDTGRNIRELLKQIEKEDL